ncbi:unnamed protein product [Cercopithifilaria johnstoni]|uniref:RNase NYN domain-containing protein n=1 Tax=Cercopithifilaria johnstoni TaxID=2874296 RepID=A0A8J2M433_9BILA|nr:unnamed protein product [Cercopithifilaria johnstoni]
MQCAEKVELDELTSSKGYSSTDNATSLRKAPQHATKRLLIIDAMNVIYMKTDHSSRMQKPLDCLLVLPIIRYFVRRGHAVEVVVPEFCIYKKCFKNFHIWKDLNTLKLLIAVPHMLHDDLVALTVARDACGSVITQDKFRDHMAYFPQLRRIRSRNIILAFTDDTEEPMFFTNAKGDKYYKGNFKCTNYAFVSEQFYSLPEDDDYYIVKNERWSEERRKEVLGHIDEIYALAEAHYMLNEGKQLSKCNPCNNPVKTSSIDVYEKIVRDNEQDEIAKDESIKTLLCWRNTAQNQELKYQLQGRYNDMYQRCITFNFAYDGIDVFGSSNPLPLEENAIDEDSKDDACKPTSVIIKENTACKSSHTEVNHLQSLKKWTRYETEKRLFKSDTHAESKAHLWKTLIGEMEIDKKSFYDFLSSFHGTVEREFVLNAYYDQLSSSVPEEEIMDPVGKIRNCSALSSSSCSVDERPSKLIGKLSVEKELMWRSLVDELNLDSSMLYNILRSWDKSPLEAERVVNAYFEHMNDWKTRFT